MGCCKGNQVEPTTDKPKPTLEEIYERELVAKRHRCTDIICIILFVVLCLVQVALSIFIFIKGGDPRDILLPHDSSGNTCKGNTPYLFYFNIYACANIAAALTSCPSPTICVSTCPSANLFYLIDSDRNTLLTYCDQTLLAARYGGSVPSTISVADYFTLASDDICPTYVLDSRDYYGRCLPRLLETVASGVTNAITTTNSSGSSVPITDVSGTALDDTTVAAGAQYVIGLLNLKTIYQSVIEDFTNSGYLIGTLLAIGAVLTFFYILVMRCILRPMVYGSLIALVLALGFVVYYCINQYITLGTGTEFSFTANISTFFSLSITWLVLGIIAGVVLIIVLLLVIVLIKRIRVSLRIIIEASKAVTGVFLTLFFPILPLLLEIGILIYFIAVSVYLSTAGTALYRSANTTDSAVSCTPGGSDPQCYFYAFGWDASSTVDQVMQFLSQYQWLPHIFNLFMFYWIECFIIGLNQMVLAGSFGIWYWSQSRSHCILFTSIKDTIVYHLGSVAFGSLLIAIVKVIRFLISYVEKKVKKAAGNNPVTKCIITFVACCCKCFFYCLEKFLKFISKNAYIMVAIYGRNFCLSAVDALKLLTANPLRAAVLDGVSSFVLFIGKLLISTSVGVLGFFFFTNSIPIDPKFAVYFAPKLHYYWVPLAVCVIGTYVIASTFFSVFEMAIDTVFLCALKDMDIHDGSVEKPYFMSSKLLKIMDVKNSDEVIENERRAKEVDKKDSDDEDDLPQPVVANAVNIEDSKH